MLKRIGRMDHWRPRRNRMVFDLSAAIDLWWCVRTFISKVTAAPAPTSAPAPQQTGIDPGFVTEAPEEIGPAAALDGAAGVLCQHHPAHWLLAHRVRALDEHGRTQRNPAAVHGQ